MILINTDSGTELTVSTKSESWAATLKILHRKKNKTYTNIYHE